MAALAVNPCQVSPAIQRQAIFVDETCVSPFDLLFARPVAVD
jgi:hypothetical protein